MNTGFVLIIHHDRIFSFQLLYLQVFRAANYDSDAEMSDLPWALARPSAKTSSKSDPRRNANPRYRVDELNEPPPRLPGIRSLIPLPGGDLLTGGTDLRIRRWDHCRFLSNSFLTLFSDLVEFYASFTLF